MIPSAEVSRRPKPRSVGCWTVRHAGTQGGSERRYAGPGKHSLGSSKESSPWRKLKIYRYIVYPSCGHIFTCSQSLNFFHLIRTESSDFAGTKILSWAEVKQKLENKCWWYHTLCHASTLPWGNPEEHKYKAPVSQHDPLGSIPVTTRGHLGCMKAGQWVAWSDWTPVSEKSGQLIRLKFPHLHVQTQPIASRELHIFHNMSDRANGSLAYLNWISSIHHLLLFP